MKCPHCGKSITSSQIAKDLRSKVKNNARTPEQARAAVNARWAKYRAQKQAGRV
jgi:hypothetical protein